GEQGGAWAPPGGTRLGLQYWHAGGDVREAPGVEPAQGAGECRAPLGRVELARQPLGGDGVQVELAVRVAARRKDEHRATPCSVQVVLCDRELAEHEPHERDEQLARARFVPRGLERL